MSEVPLPGCCSQGHMTTLRTVRVLIGEAPLCLHVPTGGLVGLALQVHSAQARGTLSRGWKQKSLQATHCSSFTIAPHQARVSFSFTKDLSPRLQLTDPRASPPL